jgi:hypothetical protein
MDMPGIDGRARSHSDGKSDKPCRRRSCGCLHMGAPRGLIAAWRQVKIAQQLFAVVQTAVVDRDKAAA